MHYIVFFSEQNVSSIQRQPQPVVNILDCWDDVCPNIVKQAANLALQSEEEIFRDINCNEVYGSVFYS
jgi:hypothetical protein